MSEPKLLVDLRRAQKALARAEADLPQNNKRERAPLEAAIVKLKKLVAMYKVAVRERIQLDNRTVLLTSSIDVLDMEKAWLMTPLRRINEARAPSPIGVVSFMGMPHPNDWDAAWLQRIRLLTPIGERSASDDQRAPWHPLMRITLKH